MKVIVDRIACQGSGLCVAVAPDVFEMAPDGAVRAVRQEVAPGQLEAVREAVHSCPLNALSLVEDDDQAR